MNLLEAKAISVRQGAVTVLDGVSLSVGRGELLIVLGPNGAGKSTLARILLGLEKPSAGVITRPPGLLVGYVPQGLRRDPTLPLSTADFLKLAARGARHDVGKLYAALGIASLLDRPIAHLSGGELRRAALARALTGDPDLLVLDEPLAGVDAASQEPIYELIAEHGRRTGAGIVLIAHEVLTAVRLAHNILCLDIKPVAFGPPAEVLSSPEFATLFGSTMSAAAISQLARSHHSPLPSLASNG